MRRLTAGQTTRVPTLCVSRYWLSVSKTARFAVPPPPPPASPRSRSVVKKNGARRPGVSKLPPPPPLSGALSTTAPPSSAAADSMGGTGGGDAQGASPAVMSFSWGSPQEVLSAMIEYIPTFYVPIQSVAAIIEDESVRASVTGRGRFQSLLRRFPFLFDVRLPDTGGAGYRAEVRLNAAADHPRRGVADAKYMMTDVGELTYFVAKPEFVIWTESVEKPGQQNVRLTPDRAPPAVHVTLEDRPPVLERLVAEIPSTFTPISALEDSVPETLLFDPYFDCQGGLAAILGKFPDDFQIVGEQVRRRPLHLAPLALDELDLANSPLPEVAALVRREVCARTIPEWVRVTNLYEQLTAEQRHALKAHGFKSLSGFLRAHGRSVAISQDMLCVSLWVSPHAAPPLRVPAAAETETAADAHTHRAHGDDDDGAVRGKRAKPSPARTPLSPREAVAALEAEAEEAFLAANARL